MTYDILGVPVRTFEKLPDGFPLYIKHLLALDESVEVPRPDWIAELKMAREYREPLTPEEQAFGEAVTPWAMTKQSEQPDVLPLAEEAPLPLEIKAELWEKDVMFPGLKATNPKDAIGSDKLPLHLWPETATVMGCLGLLDGMLKYGRSNWREAGVRATIYIDALRRHLAAWAEGEDWDPDSGLSHLSHALACLAILVDAQAAGKLVDDRQYNGAGYRRLVEMMTPHVAELKARHADKAPKHWTIADDPGTQ